MRAFHSPKHLLHQPPYEIFSGRPGPSLEAAARAEGQDGIGLDAVTGNACEAKAPGQHGEDELALHQRERATGRRS